MTMSDFMHESVLGTARCRERCMHSDGSAQFRIGNSAYVSVLVPRLSATFRLQLLSGLNSCLDLARKIDLRSQLVCVLKHLNMYANCLLASYTSALASTQTRRRYMLVRSLPV